MKTVVSASCTCVFDQQVLAGAASLPSRLLCVEIHMRNNVQHSGCCRGAILRHWTDTGGDPPFEIQEGSSMAWECSGCVTVFECLSYLSAGYAHNRRPKYPNAAFDIPDDDMSLITSFVWICHFCGLHLTPPDSQGRAHHIKG